jgi:AcrR family transcriptional regulator
VAPNDDLLPLALEAFADLGYEGASMRDLCRRLGVSHNLLHQRFGSKDRLWYAAVDHGFKALATPPASSTSCCPASAPAPEDLRPGCSDRCGA